MRIINIDDHATAEVWSGRRLFLGSPSGMLLINLPRAAMSVSLHDEIGFIYFGTAARSTVQVTGSKTKGRLLALADAIIEMDRPATALGRKVLP